MATMRAAHRRCGRALRRSTLLPLAILAMLALALPAGAADKLVLQLHGPAQFEFAGCYAALWRGFFGEAGLDVEIRPAPAAGRTGIDVVREVTEGRAQFATGTVQAMIRAAQGQPLLLLAPIFQQSGTAIYYRTDGDFPSPAALLKARLGRLPASDILDVELATALRAEGVEAASLKSVPVEAAQLVAALADRTIDAAVGSAWELPFLARERGVALKSFNPADYRVEFYGDLLFTAQRVERADPDMVRRFRAAVLKGWQYALQQPDEIIGRLVAEGAKPAAGDAAAFGRYQAEVARRLTRYPEVPLGHSNPDRWSRIEASLVGAGALVHSAEPESFLYDPDAQARGRADWWAALLLPGAAALAALVGIVLWWRWRRPQTIAAHGTAAPANRVVTVRAAAEPGLAPALTGTRIAPSLPRIAAALPRVETGNSAAAAAPPPSASGAAALSPAPPSPTAEPAAPVPPPEPAAPPQPTLPAAADLNLMLTRVERPIRQRVPRQVNFRLSLLPTLWRGGVDSRAVRAVVLDLVAAAVGDMPQGGNLIVGTRNFVLDAAKAADFPGTAIGDYVRVTIRDSGPGLSDAALDRILDPAATARPTAAMAAEAMRRIGGFVRVESAESVGTAVHLYFPRAPDSADGVTPGNPAEAAE